MVLGLVSFASLTLALAFAFLVIAIALVSTMTIRQANLALMDKLRVPRAGQSCA